MMADVRHQSEHVATAIGPFGDAAAVSMALAARNVEFAAQAMKFWANATVTALEMSQRVWGAPQAASIDAAEALPALKERARKLESAKVLPLKPVSKPVEAAQKSVTDDLKAIAGIGPKLEQMLNGLGVKSYAQIAAWTEAEVEEMDRKFGFTGRIMRDGWVEAAKKLSAARR